MRLALLATVLLLFVTEAGVTQAAPAAPPIDLQHPAATVHDPVAGLAPVNTECAAGQADLNTATAAELSSKLRIPSMPTVNRIIAMRPWLKGSDLSSVPGIGPSRATELAPGTCATQPALPPDTPLACTSKSQVDLQAATASEIADRLKLPRVTADGIVAARPLSQDLDQVVTPRVPGLSQPTVDRLQSANAVCVTPAPMYAGGSAWRWGTADGGVVVRRNGFGLIVPPGRILSSVGAYASVTPLSPDEGILPRMDGHIWGAWDTPNTTVAVQGPWSNDADSSLAPVLIHAAGAGDSESVGSSVAVSNVDGVSTLTGLQTSLSVSTFGAAPSCSTDRFTGSVFCLDQLLDGTYADAWRSVAEREAAIARTSFSEKPSCGTAGVNPISATLGKLPFGLNCVLSQDPSGTGTWAITNDASSSALGLESLEVVYHYSLTPGGSSVNTVDGVHDPDAWVDAIRAVADEHSHFLLGKQTLTIQKLPDSPETRLDVTADPVASGTWAVLPSLVDLVGPALGAQLKALANAPAQCEQLINADDLGSIVKCVKGVTDSAVDSYLASHPAPDDPSKASSLQRIAKTVKFGLKALNVASFAGSFGSAIFSDSTSGTAGAIVMRNNRPAPTGSGGGQSPGSSFIVRDPNTHRALLVKPSGKVFTIPDGGTFNCLAATMFVWDNAGMPQLNAPTAGAANCDDAGPVQWDMRPVAQGGNIPNNVILRERPEDASDGVIASWLINNRGEIQTIHDGGTYLCLGYSNPVIWNVPYGFPPFVGIAEWTPVGTAPASCG